jgi:peptidyl-prolyl cis-trans isomerase D
MLGFFRRIINSRVGIVVTLGTLAIIAISFAAGDVTGLRTSGTGGLTGGKVAAVGGESITAAELKTRVGSALDAERQQQPSLDIGQFLSGGALDGILDQLVTGLALQRFGERVGMVVNKRMVDRELNSIPALQGPNGKFDPATYQRLLTERRLTDAGIRGDIARQIIAQQLTVPIVGASQVPEQVALPYASLLLERRDGQVAIIPNSAGANGPAPTAADLRTFYLRNAARYTVPERRAVRFALVSPDAVKARAAPTDAEIAAAYNGDRTRFAPTEKRTVEQVVALDQATAAGIAAKVKGGTSLADAARAAGLDASTQTAVTKAAYAGVTAPPVADAVFATAKGAVIGPVRAPLGWTVARVTAVQSVAGRSLDQARADLVPEITRRKTLQALSAIHDALEDSLAKHATFDELIADQKLSAQASPALLANGTDPLNPAFEAPPALVPVLQAAFGAEEGDEPQLVPTAEDGSFALVALGRIIRAAPRPLAEVQASVTRDFLIDRAHREARRVALQVLGRVNGGTPFAQALAAARLPAPRPVGATRAQLAANPQAAPAPLVLMFSMAQGSAKMLEAPNGAGWLLVRLDKVTSADARGRRDVVAATRTDLGRNVGREYAEQFVRAVRADVGVKLDPGAVARVKADLTGANGAGGN